MTKKRLEMENQICGICWDEGSFDGLSRKDNKTILCLPCEREEELTYALKVIADYEDSLKWK
jgi:hypothetical protein